MKQTPGFRRVVDATLDGFIVVAVAVLVLDVLWGVFTRYVLGSPSRWTEEVAQYLLMWVALFGAAAAFGRGEHLGFDYVATKLSPAARRLSRALCHAIVLAFVALVMVFGGFRLVADTFVAGQVTPALEVNKGLVYLALPLSGCFALYYESTALWRSLHPEPGEAGATGEPASET